MSLSLFFWIAMKGKKTLFLFLALLLPVCVFVFLKIFGKNQFDVPVLFKAEIPVDANSCEVNHSLPYTLPDSLITKLFAHASSDYLLLAFSADTSFVPRIENEVGAREIEIIQVSDTTFQPGSLNFVRNCVLLLKPPFDLELIDKQGQIRGQYTATDRDEIDRLIVELKIILRKY